MINLDNTNNNMNNIDLLEDDDNVCRICLESISEFEDDQLRNRCQCKSAKYHDRCIIKWINVKKSKQCDIVSINFHY